MRQAITTKYLGPTNSRGSRIKAIARKKQAKAFGNGSYPEQSVTVPYSYEGTEQAHCAAAKACAEKLGWSGLWIGGGNVDEDGYVFVCVDGALRNALGFQTGAFGTEGRDWFFVEAREA